MCGNSVDHVGQIVDVEAAGRHVGCDQHPHLPDLNASRVSVRCCWLLSPWIESAAMAWRSRKFASRLHANLVSTKTSTLVVGLMAKQMGEQVALQARTRHRVDPVGDGFRDHVATRDLDQLGFFSIWSAALISSEKVAEKSGFGASRAAALGCGGCPE